MLGLSLRPSKRPHHLRTYTHSLWLSPDIKYRLDSRWKYLEIPSLDHYKCRSNFLKLNFWYNLHKLFHSHLHDTYPPRCDLRLWQWTISFRMDCVYRQCLGLDRHSWIMRSLVLQLGSKLTLKWNWSHPISYFNLVLDFWLGLTWCCEWLLSRNSLSTNSWRFIGWSLSKISFFYNLVWVHSNITCFELTFCRPPNLWLGRDKFKYTFSSIHLNSSMWLCLQLRVHRGWDRCFTKLNTCLAHDRRTQSKVYCKLIRLSLDWNAFNWDYNNNGVWH